MIATEAGADFAKLHKAMTSGYDRAQDFPGAGFAAGPCLLKDTMQLSAFYQNNFLLGHAGMLINEGMPGFVVNQIQRNRGDLKQEVVGILGMAFKADVDDIRDSLSYKIGKLLRFNGATVLYSDEFATDPTFISKEELVERSSIVILGAPHSAYKSLKIPSRVYLVDVWGFLNKAQ
jgi:UDP-N-acetyl-D-mannosaminuronic acid dehydrogenase